MVVERIKMSTILIESGLTLDTGTGGTKTSTPAFQHAGSRHIRLSGAHPRSINRSFSVVRSRSPQPINRSPPIVDQP